MAKQRTLIVLSIPFLRCARVLLAPPLLMALRGPVELAVVAPEGSEKLLRPVLEKHGIAAEFITWRPAASGWIGRILLGISELMRVNGYFFRHRRVLPHYWKTLSEQLGDEGQDSRKPLSSRVVAWLTGVFGAVPGLWWGMETLAVKATSLGRLSELDRRLESAGYVRLIQCANWGKQDRLLRRWAARLGVRKVLIPYTTDQFWVNGYLPPDYAVVCPQGAFEQKCLTGLQEIGSARIERLGNLWFRYAASLHAESDHGGTTAIVYAGVSEPYFPKSSEIAALEVLHAAKAEGIFGDCRLLYRPYARSDSERDAITERVVHLQGLELQWPQKASSGFEFASTVPFEEDLRDYVSQLAGCAVMVMSHTTTLGMDASFLGSGVVSNFWDPSGAMERRSSPLRFNAEGRFDWWPELPVVHDAATLVEETRRQLLDPAARENVRAGLLREWDFDPPDLPVRLARVLFGDNAETPHSREVLST